MAAFCLVAERTSGVAGRDHLTLLQARKTVGVRRRHPLHIVVQALEPRGFAEITLLLLLWRQSRLLQDVVEAEVVLWPVLRGCQVHHHGHDLDSPALEGETLVRIQD